LEQLGAPFARSGLGPLRESARCCIGRSPSLIDAGSSSARRDRARHGIVTVETGILRARNIRSADE
jgi:hypothetical protein